MVDPCGVGRSASVASGAEGTDACAGLSDRRPGAPTMVYVGGVGGKKASLLRGERGRGRGRSRAGAVARPPPQPIASAAMPCRLPGIARAWQSRRRSRARPSREGGGGGSGGAAVGGWCDATEGRRCLPRGGAGAGVAPLATERSPATELAQTGARRAPRRRRPLPASHSIAACSPACGEQRPPPRPPRAPAGATCGPQQHPLSARPAREMPGASCALPPRMRRRTGRPRPRAQTVRRD